MNQIWFVTTDAVSPEGYYIAAPTKGRAKAIGANEIGRDFTSVRAEKIEGQQTELEGVIGTWDAQCFLCGRVFRTVHSPMEVPPACDSCRKARPGTAQLQGNNL